MRGIKLNRQKLGLEDLLFGVGIVTQIRAGQNVEVTKINAGNLPFDETQSLLEWAQSVNIAELGSMATELQAIYDNLTTIGTIEDNLTIINTLEDNLVALQSLYTNISKLQNIDTNMSKLQNIDTNMSTLQNIDTNMSTLQAIYNDLTKLESIYDNLTMLLAIYNNLTALNNINSQVIPNLTELLLVNDNAIQVAADKLTVATDKGIVSGYKDDVSAMKLAVETIYDTFDARFLGTKANDPTVDNDGNALIDGAMYFNTSSNAMKVYDLWNTIWVTIPQIYLSGLLDVQLTSITTGDLLIWNGTKWVNTRTPKVDSIQLNGGSSTDGILSWNPNEGTADLTLPGGSILQIGQEEVRTVRNSTASPIPDGTIVMFDGTIGNSGRVKVKPFTGGFNEAHLLYGVTTQLILAGMDGIINIAGKVRGINTTGSLYGETWVDGDILYAKPDDAGALTKVVPADDKLKLRVAVVVHSHTSGTLEIRFTPFNENMYYTKSQSDALKVPINLSGATEKATPVDEDLIALSDSVSSFSLKKLSWLDLKVTVKTYFDTLFVKKITSTDNAIVRFNGITGDIKNSGVTINDSNNIGIASNPSPLGSSYRGININNSGELFSSSNATFLSNNLYYDGTNYRYKNNGIASVLYQASGQFVFANAVSGLAGAVATLKSSVISANHDMLIGDASMSGNRYIAAYSGTLANDEACYLSAGGGLSGAITRSSSLGIHKHSAITNPCGYLRTQSQDAGVNILWTDDIDQLRIGNSMAFIGTTSGTVVGTQTSDERVKNIVGTCPYGLQEILELETYKYAMKDDVEGSYKLGFVAQQAMGVIPESVYDTNERLTKPVTVTKYKVVQEAIEDEEGNIVEPEVTEPYEDIEYQETSDTVTKLAMDYQMMIPVLVNAMKEQQAMIETLKQEIEILKGVN